MGQCAATTKAGNSCKNPASDGQKYCHVHKKQRFWRKIASGSALILILGLISVIADVTGILGFIGFTPFLDPTSVQSSNEDEALIQETMWSDNLFNSITDSYNMQDVFPFFIGNTWSYNVSQFSEAPGQEAEMVQVIGTYSEKVITIESALSDEVRIVGMEVSGENYLSKCSGESPISGNLDKWYVFNSSFLFEVCSKNDAYSLARSLQNQEDFSISTPDYAAPFKVGNLWPAFQNLPSREDTAYQWFVEAMVDVRVPSGEFKDCYRLLLYTLPSTTVRWVCPGFGLVAAEYHHHGATVDYRAELRQLNIKEIQTK